MIDTIRENQRWIIILSAGWIAAGEFGYAPLPWEIEGIGVVATAGVVAMASGYLVAGKVDDLLPDPEGIYIVAFESSDDTGGKVWEVTEDQFSAMEIHGSLFEWPTSKRVYEVLGYRPEENVAVGNWRESIAGSQLAGDSQVRDAMDQIAEIREEFEPEARRARHLRRRIKSIVRILDRRRMMDQEQILDPTVNPTFEDDEATVGQVIREQVPDELQPEHIRGDNVEDEPEEETIAFDVLDGMDGMDEPLARNDD